jgi:hypothetical protein
MVMGDIGNDLGIAASTLSHDLKKARPVLCSGLLRVMHFRFTANNSIEQKRVRIENHIKHNPGQGHSHQSCGGIETECTEFNLDHPLTFFRPRC